MVIRSLGATGVGNFRGFGAVVANADALFMVRRRGLPVRQRQVSAELRAWRKKAGFTCAEVAEALGTSITKISRMETGERGLYPDDVAAMLGFLKVPQKPRQELLEKVRNSGDPNWWQMARVDLPAGWRDLMVLEQDATAIANFEPILVPGLLQTAEYATALIHGTDDELSEQEVQTWVANRMARQTLLTKRKAPTLHAIIDEMVLHRPVGEPGVMHRQLQHLLTCVQRSNITLQVAPIAVGASTAMFGPLVLLDLPEGDSVAHLETRQAGVFLSEESPVQAIKLDWQRLCAVALAPEKTVRLIAAVAGKLT